MSLWRKRNVKHYEQKHDNLLNPLDRLHEENVHHNEQKPDHLVNILPNLSIKSEQKHDNLSDPLDLLHEENVRLGLYEGVYDLSIKSDDLSIKSEKAMREVQRLGQEIEIEYVLKIKEDNDIQEYKMPWQPLNWGDMPVGQVNNLDFMEGARWAEKSLKEKNA